MNLFVLNTVIYIYICPNIVSKLTAHKTDCPNKYFVSVQGWGGEVGGLGGGVGVVQPQTILVLLLINDIKI